MMHATRRWGVGPADSPEDLAKKLTDRTWTLCTGFYVEGHPNYLFLNDSTCEDAAAEYAAVLGGLDAKTHRQLESITFSWCSYAKALEYVKQALAGAMDGNDFARPVHPRVEPIDKHGRCHFCA